MTEGAHSPFIRTATRQDASSIAAILAAGTLTPGREDPSATERYAEAIEDIVAGPSTVLVAEVDGTVVGVCQLIVFRHLQGQGGWCAEVESLHVTEYYRSGGIGGALLEEAARRASSQGCYRLQLTSNLERTDAHRFYEQHGFEPSHLGFKRLL
jgi:GNAT superfamily N-acetyltransferase